MLRYPDRICCVDIGIRYDVVFVVFTLKPFLSPVPPFVRTDLTLDAVDSCGHRLTYAKNGI